MRVVPRIRAMALSLILGSLPILASSAAPSVILAATGDQSLLAQAADRYTSLGVPTDASELTVVRTRDGEIVIGPSRLAKELELRTDAAAGSMGQAREASVNVGRGLAPTVQTGESPVLALTEATSAAPYWTIRESGCFSLYVDSARFDNCYRIMQVVNDGVSSKNYWALKQWGTAYESGGGLSSLWLKGERNGGTPQAWEDWGPVGNLTANCTQRWVGIEVIVTTGQNYEVCETWTQTKSASGSSPWLREQWNCAGWFCSVNQDTRALAQIMEVSVTPTATPLFRITYGMGA
jgi:hypothetical protein